MEGHTGVGRCWPTAKVKIGVFLRNSWRQFWTGFRDDHGIGEGGRDGGGM